MRKRLGQKIRDWTVTKSPSLAHTILTEGDKMTLPLLYIPLKSKIKN
jgi:hypothetical protein